jgi:uncharacterized protein YegP (UPF0339 family)
MDGSAQYEVFPDKAGEWRWRLRAGNGEIVAQSEGYSSKEHARDGVSTVATLIADTSAVVFLDAP